MKVILAVVVLSLTASISQAGPWPAYCHYGYGYHYAPSTYMEWNDAVAYGKQIIAEQQKSLGQVAREYRARKAQEQNAASQALPAAPKTDSQTLVCPPAQTLK
jgi:hypothetical protein